jgi:putative ABC transport system permease protein
VTQVTDYPPTFRSNTSKGNTEEEFVTLPRFVVRNLLRNKRRSLLTAISLAFSFLLLIFMISIWRSLYVESWTAKGALRLVCRHRVSLFLAMPGYYQQKIRALPGVANVAPFSVFDGVYRTGKGEENFGQFGTDPGTFLDVYQDLELPPDQVAAWKRDPSGAVASVDLARNLGWKIGDRIILEGVRYPVNIELNLRGIYRSSMPNGPLFFNWDCVEQTLHRGKYQVFLIRADSPRDVGTVAAAVDDLFHNAPEPTRTEAEKTFDLHIIESMGNVKLFILSICLAALFAMTLMSANTIAMSIRERTREIAVLRSLGFAPRTLLSLLVGESVGLCIAGWLLGSIGAFGIVYALVHSAGGEGFQVLLKLKWPTVLFCFLVAVMVGCFSAIFPAHRVSHTPIVEGLRHIG